MFKQFRKSALVLVGLAGSLPAAAAQVTVNHVVDLSGVAVQNAGFGDYVSKIYDFPPSVQIASGDAVDMTISFASGQTGDVEVIHARSQPRPGARPSAQTPFRRQPSWARSLASDTRTDK